MARKKRTTRRKPILNPTEFVEQHDAQYDYLEGYLLGSYGRQHDTGALRAEMMAGVAKSLYASNRHTRIAFMSAARNAFERNMPNPKGGFFMLTLAPDIFVTPLWQALKFDTETLRDWVHGLLDQADYFGMIDLA